MLLSALQLGYELSPNDPIEMSIHIGEKIIDFIDKATTPEVNRQYDNTKIQQDYNFSQRFASFAPKQNALVGERNMAPTSFTRFNLRPRNSVVNQRSVVGVI